MTPTTLWRITRAPYADLTGEGARLFGGRWSPVGVPLLYTSTGLALAALETLVHTDPDLVPGDLVAVRIDTSILSTESHSDATLPAGWRDELGSVSAQNFGAGWAQSGRSALLALPSALLPARAATSELNVLINPVHPDAAGIRIAEVIPFSFDPRLLQS